MPIPNLLLASLEGLMFMIWNPSLGKCSGSIFTPVLWAKTSFFLTPVLSASAYKAQVQLQKLKRNGNVLFYISKRHEEVKLV